ncbi:hypothetical protein IFM89_037617 [Coptis chinensis]|uniref:Dirigent protein n=1 Tax=Coptis chinensis TaxID=261450 RepID=A0A835HBN3_9MAGN|nr:hypothetical protein IFM89_037617 [Coptis chinensis]
MEEKVTNFHFYFHDTISGNNPSAIVIAGPKDNSSFGTTRIADEPLTEGPEPTSKLIGKAQGIYSEAAQQELGLLMIFSYAFLEDKYNGSTLSVLGRNPVLHTVREMPIVGGTGLFRFARGQSHQQSHRGMKVPKVPISFIYSAFLTSTTIAMASVLTNFFNLLVLSTIFIITNGENSEWISETKLLGQMKEKVSHLHFYFHDTISGGKPSAKQIAGPKVPGFGTMMIADDPLTEGFELTSKLIGKAQGIYALAAQKELGLLMVLNYAFMEGKYNGSTLSLLGKNSVLHPIREMSIVGGTGLFRFARGYALAKTAWFNTKGDAVVEYNVTVLHY